MNVPASVLASEEEALRARFWGLLATLLIAPPKAETLAQLATIDADDSTPMGRALRDLARAAAETDAGAAEEEFNDLFIGLARGELIPFGSYYLTGFLHEKPLAVLRADLAALGIALSDGVAESEDHVAILADIMQGLIAGAFAAPLEAQREFFTAHLAPWAGRFFTDLENANAARFYRPVGALGRLFLEVEAEAFAMTE